jgi:hypothetical protein
MRESQKYVGVDTPSKFRCDCPGRGSSLVFFCHRENQVLARRDQPKIGSIALRNLVGIGSLFEEFRPPLFRPAACYQVSEPALFLFVQLSREFAFSRITCLDWDNPG